MKEVVIAIVIFFSVVTVGNADTYRHAVGFDFGVSNITGGWDNRFPFETGFGLRFSTHMIGKWRLELGATYERIYDDSSTTSFFKLGTQEVNRTVAWESYNLHLLCKYRLLSLNSRFSIDAGIGGGIADWRITDAHLDTLLNARNERGEWIDLAATEVMISVALGFEYRLGDRFKIDLDLQTNYLTSWGQEFDPIVEDNLSNWNNRLSLGISVLLGRPSLERTFPRDYGPQDLSHIYLESIRSQYPEAGHGLAYYKGPDTDHDGVPDIFDRCPNTTAKAHGLIDIHGCPVDSDCDGFPDYRDDCPYNRLGAAVDDRGCPLDTDGDGVPDGLDDCPGSDPELPVNLDGCVNIQSLNVPMVLHIRYTSGSFEIDPEHKKILEDLSRILLKASGIKVEINGYTDNIGTAEANLALSQKRANRVRDYLVSLGVRKDRLTAVGRGESGFVASNETREGRRKNRRVELIFYK
jgi:OOP family OmpA-OmpF porin